MWGHVGLGSAMLAISNSRMIVIELEEDACDIFYNSNVQHHNWDYFVAI